MLQPLANLGRLPENHAPCYRNNRRCIIPSAAIAHHCCSSPLLLSHARISSLFANGDSEGFEQEEVQHCSLGCALRGTKMEPCYCSKHFQPKFGLPLPCRTPGWRGGTAKRRSSLGTPYEQNPGVQQKTNGGSGGGGLTSATTSGYIWMLSLAHASHTLQRGSVHSSAISHYTHHVNHHTFSVVRNFSRL